MGLIGRMGMNTRNIRFRSNRVRDILSLFHEELDGMYGSGEVSTFGEMLFESFLGWDKVRLLTSKEQTIDQSDLLRFHWALEDLKRHHPVQHIIGHVDFCGCRISVSPDVLIPRPETEEMVNWIAMHCELRVMHGGILDLCTGSGCIAIALKRSFPQADVTAVDISPAAIETARQNAESNGVEVRFVEGDVLGGANVVNGHYGLIVSNPPYIMESERALMQPNVLDHEPALALFVPDDDPLRFYRAIALTARRHLAPDGLLAVEINEALAEETCQLMLRHGLHPTLHTDFRGKHRTVTATLIK